MKLLFDENLSPSLVRLLADLFPGSCHITTVAAKAVTDTWIWDYAHQHSYAIVSKDNDFRQRSFLRGAPPKIIWLSVGNAGTASIAKLLRERHADLLDFETAPDASLLIVSI